MKKGLTEIVFIIDRSGSMSGLEADTIGGFNGLLEKQKKEDGEAYVSVVLFDGEGWHDILEGFRNRRIWEPDKTLRQIVVREL